MLKRHALSLFLIVATCRQTFAQRSDWPVYGGSDDHTHYTKLSQIGPSNVGRLEVAWTYETHDEFSGSEMQTNPIVVDACSMARHPSCASSHSMPRRARSSGASTRIMA